MEGECVTLFHLSNESSSHSPLPSPHTYIVMVHVGKEGWLGGTRGLQPDMAQLKKVGDVLRSEVWEGTALHVKHHSA